MTAFFATYTDNGKVFEGCWQGGQNGIIELKYKDGDIGRMPMALFRKPMNT